MATTSSTHAFPEQARILNNIEVFSLWEDFVKIANDRSHITDIDADREFGLNIHTINRHDYDRNRLAAYYNFDWFLFALQSKTPWVHDYRKLYILFRYAYAIAEPDQDISDEIGANSYGIMFYGARAYDMEMEVTLDLSDYEYDAKRLVFFFALKTSYINLVEIPKFLAYQLRETFKGNPILFKSFLKALMLQYKTIDVNMSLVRFSFTENPILDLNNKVRHIYDIHKLLEDRTIQAFFESKDFDEMLLRVGNEDVKSFKNNNAWLANHPQTAILFSDPERHGSKSNAPINHLLVDWYLGNCLLRR
jgi:hypothetical protein